MIATTSKQLRKSLIVIITMALGFICLVGCGLKSDPLANNSNSKDNPGDEPRLLLQRNHCRNLCTELGEKWVYGAA